MRIELLTFLKSALLWLWIFLTKSLNSHFLHALCLKWSVVVVCRYCCNCINYIHTLCYLTKCGVCTV